MLMIWSSLARAAPREMELINYPPCTFNPLCTCSKAAPELGIVQCRNVPLPSIPNSVNRSKVFMLHMERTGLRELEPYFLQATGLYRLEISHNLLTEIPDDSFVGLERSLWELMLHHNELIDVPSRAIRHLQKLRHLDLSGNQISCLEPDSFRGLEDSLQILILSKNLLNKLPPDSFATLPLLDILDLSGNNIAEIDSNIFRDGMPRLSKLLLSDNILTEIPYVQVAPLRQLRTLDLSHNLIKHFIQPTGGIFDESNNNYSSEIFQPGPIPTLKPMPIIKLTLDALHLEYNLLETLPTASFKNFDIVNVTFLDGNPLIGLGDEAFRPTKIRELYIRFCNLHYVSPLAFEGLGTSLQILDMSGNNISDLSENIFHTLDILRVLNLRGNKLVPMMHHSELLNGFHSTLLKLDLSGDNNAATNLQELRRLRNLRSLSLSRLSSSNLGPDDFMEFGFELEDLKITAGALQTIKAHAFVHVRGIKRLDLSENKISQIEPDAFNEIGHSLQSLKISHGFAGSMSTLPAEAMRHLTSLQELDISNNQLKTMTDTCFHFLKDLRILEMHDNRLEQVLKGTFQGDIHTNLAVIKLGFNHIKLISQHTFVDLEALQRLQLDDNRIEHIERRAFMNLDRLRQLSLRGNKLTTISDEAFQNLPELENLDLAYNSLTMFDFDYFDQVGTLASLRVNVSYNKIKELTDNSSGFNLGRSDGTVYHSNIKILDLSHNNISRISTGFFKPAELSVTQLYLGHNSIMNTTRDLFGNMPQLQWLDLSHNLISNIDFDTFKNTKNLQLLYLSENSITDVPQNLFKSVHDLRVVDFSHNQIRSLPDNLFPDDGMESLDLSHNFLYKIPVTSLSNMAALTMCELDLSHNNIQAIHSMDLSNKFRSLSMLDLSYNKLLRLNDAAFATLPHLSVLILSHNEDLKVMDKAFVGLQNSLIKLGLNNVSLTTVPDLPLPSLRVLQLAQNDLPSISQELSRNMSQLRALDLSGNDLSTIPLLLNSLTNLRWLSFAGNSIKALTNNSFAKLSEDLEYLDVSHLDLNAFELGALDTLHALRSLHLSTYPKISNFNIPAIVDNVYNLRELWIEGPIEPEMNELYLAGSGIQMNGDFSTNLAKEMLGDLPLKLNMITISGTSFTHLADNIFRGIQSPYLHISLVNTSISNLPITLFRDLGEVQNISIDVRGDNEKLTQISNPNSAIAPHTADKVFLTDIKVSGNALNCDCGIGWLEFWHRKKRQYFCSSQTWSDSAVGLSSRSPYSMAATCNDIDDDLRETKCSNKNNQQLLEILKSDIECGWDSSSTRLEIALVSVTLSVIFVLWF